MTTVGFVGLGNMGRPMAANLVRAGHRVAGFDLVPAAAEAARAAGVAIAGSAREAAAEAHVVLTMLPAGRHVVEVWTALVEAVRPGTLMVDCSTVDVEAARAAHALAAARGLPALDAPVSGGTVGAEGAALTFMVGGEAAAFEQGRDLLGRMGRRVVHCGGPGAGQAAKICNNMILGITMIGISEAFVLAEGLGLSHQALFDVASTSSGSCWALTTHCPVPGPVPASAANHGYEPGFAVDLMTKDLRLAQAAALASGAATPLGAEAAALYGLLQAAGQGGKDYSAVINFLRGKTEG